MGRLETPGTPPLIADLWSRCCGRDLGFLCGTLLWSLFLYDLGSQLSGKLFFFGSNSGEIGETLGLVRYFVEWGEDCGSEWCGFHVCCCCFFFSKLFATRHAGISFFKKKHVMCFPGSTNQCMHAFYLSLCVFLSFFFSDLIPWHSSPWTKNTIWGNAFFIFFQPPYKQHPKIYVK